MKVHVTYQFDFKRTFNPCTYLKLLPNGFFFLGCPFEHGYRSTCWKVSKIISTVQAHTIQFILITPYVLIFTQ